MKRTVREVVDERVVAKREAKLSDVHIKDLESRLGRFANGFQLNIGGVSGQMLQAWLDGMDASGRTKRNYLMQIAALFRFAAKRKYLPKDAIEEVEAVQKVKENNGEPEIFTPDEMCELLGAARPEMIPFLSIGGFAGLRRNDNGHALLNLGVRGADLGQTGTRHHQLGQENPRGHPAVEVEDRDPKRGC